jgi:hypothetical protein
MGDENNVAPVSRSEVKMPKFLPDQPAVFFVMTESQFALRNVTSDDAKYHHVVSALPPEVVSRIVDLVTAPPTTDKYDTIKQRLTDSFAGTSMERAAKLLEITDLGGRHPLALRDEMRNLARGEDSEFLLRAIFLRALPDEVRRVVRDSTTLDEMATAAGNHFTKTGAALDPRRSVYAAGSDTDDADSVAAFRRHPERAGSKPSAPRERDICFYHAKFGANAKKCNAPCKMAPPSTSNGQRRPGNADAGGK